MAGDKNVESEVEETRFVFDSKPPWFRSKTDFELLFELPTWEETIDFDRILGFTEELENSFRRRLQ